MLDPTFKFRWLWEFLRIPDLHTMSDLMLVPLFLTLAYRCTHWSGGCVADRHHSIQLHHVQLLDTVNIIIIIIIIISIIIIIIKSNWFVELVAISSTKNLSGKGIMKISVPLFVILFFT